MKIWYERYKSLKYLNKRYRQNLSFPRANLSIYCKPSVQCERIKRRGENTFLYKRIQIQQLCQRSMGHPFSSVGNTIDTDFLGPFLCTGTCSNCDSIRFCSSGTWTRFGLLKKKSILYIISDYIQKIIRCPHS